MTEKMNGVEELRAATHLFDHCVESFNERFTAEELLAIFRARVKCARDFFPDEWTDRQVQNALRGKTPDWNDDETPKYDEERPEDAPRTDLGAKKAALVLVPRDGWGLDPGKEDEASYATLVVERVWQKFGLACDVRVTCSVSSTMVFSSPDEESEAIEEYIGNVVWNAWCAGERAKETL